MAGVAENINVRVTLKLEKNQQLKWHVGGNDFRIEQLSSNYQATFPLRCGKFILTATVARGGFRCMLS